MGQFEEDACLECDYCGNIFTTCMCEPQDFQHLKEPKQMTFDPIDNRSFEREHLESCIKEEPKQMIQDPAKQHLENCLKEVDKHIDTLLPQKKPRWLSPRGIEVEMIRETANSVTLMVYDNPSDPHEWTTTLDNFANNYTPIDTVS